MTELVALNSSIEELVILSKNFAKDNLNYCLQNQKDSQAKETIIIDTKLEKYNSVRNNSLQKLLHDDLINDSENMCVPSIFKSCVEKLRELNFDIYEYVQHFENKKPDIMKYFSYSPVYEFLCKYKSWVFTTYLTFDIDIPEGIFGLRNPYCLESNSELEFYCDLNCKNTSPTRMYLMLIILNDTLDNFYNNRTKFITEIPNIIEANSNSKYEIQTHFGENSKFPNLEILVWENIGIKKSITLNVSLHGFDLIDTQNDKFDEPECKISVEDLKICFYYKEKYGPTSLIDFLDYVYKIKSGKFGYYDENLEKWFNQLHISSYVDACFYEARDNYPECHSNWLGLISHHQNDIMDLNLDFDYEKKLFNVWTNCKFDLLLGQHVHYNDKTQSVIKNSSGRYEQYKFHFVHHENKKHCELSIKRSYMNKNKCENTNYTTLSGDFFELVSELRNFLIQIYKNYNMDLEFGYEFFNIQFESEYLFKN